MTIRKYTDLLNLFADGQPAGSITPDRIRDLIETIMASSGWGAYQDGQFTELAPQQALNGVATKVLIDAASKEEQELPFGLPKFWDEQTNEIVVPTAGSGLLVTFETITRRISGQGDWDYRTFIDIGLVDGNQETVELYPRTIGILDNGWKKITWSTGAYGLDTWLANKAEIYVQSDTNFQFYASRVIPHLLHRGQGIYPPA